MPNTATFKELAHTAVEHADADSAQSFHSPGRCAFRVEVVLSTCSEVWVFEPDAAEIFGSGQILPYPIQAHFLLEARLFGFERGDCLRWRHRDEENPKSDKRVLIDPPEREPEELPEIQADAPPQVTAPKNFNRPLPMPELGIV